MSPQRNFDFDLRPVRNDIRRPVPELAAVAVDTTGVAREAVALELGAKGGEDVGRNVRWLYPARSAVAHESGETALEMTAGQLDAQYLPSRAVTFTVAAGHRLYPGALQRVQQKAADVGKPPGADPGSGRRHPR